MLISDLRRKQTKNSCGLRGILLLLLVVIALFLGSRTSAASASKAGQSTASQKKKTFYSVAHMGYNKKTHRGRNLYKSFKAAKKHGFNAVECDIQITSDDVFILSHEDVITDPLTGTEYKTWKTPWEVLKDIPYYEGKLMTFKKLLSYCKKNGLHIYIDKMSQFKDQETWDSIFALVDKYKMKTKVTWLIYKEEDAQRILTWYPKSRIGFLILNDYMLDTVIERANNAKTSKSKIFIDFLAGNYFTPELLSTLKDRVKKGITFEVWNISKKAVYKSYLPYVTGITTDYYCRADVVK